MNDQAKSNETLDKLLAAIERREVTIFDDEEVIVLRQVIKVWNGLSALGWLSDSLVRVLKVAAVVAAVSMAIKHGSWDELRHLTGLK